MKKLLLSLTLLLALGVVANHATAQNGTTFGVRGGLNFANLNDTDSDADIDSRTGLMAGVYARIHIPNSPVYLQPEVLYTQKGAESSDLFEDQEATLKIKLDYIEVPVLARFDFITGGSITPHVYFGPYVSFSINSEVEVSDGESSFAGDIEEDVKDLNFGIVTGAGLDFGRLNLGVRYGAGLTDTFEDGDGKNSVFSVTAGIDF